MIIRKSSDFKSIKEDWGRLLKEDKEATPFQSWQWLEAYEKHYKKGEVFILGGYKREKLEAIGVFEKLEAEITLLGGGRTDYQDILSHNKKETWQAFLQFFIDKGLKNFSFHHLREFSSSLEILRALSLELNFNFEREPIGVAPCLKLPESWEQYLESLTHHKRKEIKRKIKKLADFTTEKFCFKKEFHQKMNSFFQLYRASSPEKIMDETKEGFYLRVAENMAPFGWPELCFLYLEKKPIAAYFSFIFKNRLFLYNAGFDREYQKLSPGAVLLSFMIKEQIKLGREVFDFLQGDERYKYDFGAEDQKLFKVKLNYV